MRKKVFMHVEQITLIYNKQKLSKMGTEDIMSKTRMPTVAISI
jgi:hypothetical protein